MATPNSATAESVLHTLKYVHEFVGRKVVLKLGGSVLEDDALLKSIAEDIMAVRKIGIELVVVHGGGPAINEELTRRGITWEFVDGLRVTTPEMMDVIEMVLCGKVNR